MKKSEISKQKNKKKIFEKKNKKKIKERKKTTTMRVYCASCRQI